MYTSTIASVALMASAALAQGAGNAIVQNGCNYDVHLSNVPAANGGYTQIDKVLSPNETYSQQFTELSNGMGWSIKLSKSAVLDHIMQYEYTYHSDGIIWFDLSEVDGNPWDGNWEISATGGNGCTPKQSAYRYATDDAYGMQDCQSDADITVLLCSGEQQNDASASAISSAASSTSAAATEAPSSSYVAPASTSEEATSTPQEATSTSAEASQSYQTVEWNPTGGWFHRHEQVATSESISQTTFATLTTKAPGVTVTNIATAVVTEVVTMTQYANKRDAHEHQHRHMAPRHPHAARA